MKAMILAAGLGTRLRPWTLNHPKALVPVAGVPMLQRIIESLKDQGFYDLIINVHHFADQIIEFVNKQDFGVGIGISDESCNLLDTGGGLLQALDCFADDDEPVLVHNVDILSNVDLKKFMQEHLSSGNDVSLLTSNRDSSRKLIFDSNGMLMGWHNLISDELRPAGFKKEPRYEEEAFSGIYIVNSSILNDLKNYSQRIKSVSFPIMDFFLENINNLKIGRIHQSEFRMIDIGKPDALNKAEEMLKMLKR